jgi:small conductance mechanosensitive channel
VNLNLSRAWDTVERLVNSTIAALPRLLLALIAIGAFWLAARAVRALIRRYAARQGGHYALEQALGRLAQAAIIVLGLLVGTSIAFPTFSPADLVGLLGIGTVAVGFAFKDIFQNFLAGILILATRPFRIGDQIVVQNYEGTVEDIQTRATLIRTYDGRRVVIPNSDLYTTSVTVNTAFPVRRIEQDVGIGYGDDIERARALILEAIREVEEVKQEPAPDVLVTTFAESSVTLRARWWGDSPQIATLRVQDRVLTAINGKLSANGIDLPFPTRQILFHDQTEETDGDRRRQREGWPAGAGEVPAPRSLAHAILRLAEARSDAGNGAAVSAHEGG